MDIEKLSQAVGVMEFNQNRKNNEVNARLAALEALDHASSEGFGELESRIKVLEEARQRQIAFNATVSLKEAKKDEKKEVKSFWERFK